MSLILNIDTALETASICLSKDKKILQLSINKNQKDHAAWLSVAIQNMMKGSGYQLNQLNVIAVTIGPGSYTGLRVGLSAAKGLCYALNVPLITIGTLEMMAFA
ncbi:MAG: tRNA (adenosine(37)-N6)-threonylcarbamoyltransferase complex dimerization subunit type 1 TsaB, partial [Chitinophagales bacterium]